MNLKSIRYEVKAATAGQKIALITMSRPEAMNALNREVLEDMKVLLFHLESQRDIRAAILTGDGEKSFVAGADIKEMENLTSAQAYDLTLNGQSLFQRLEDLPFPVIAAVNGFALGGGLELALSCDFIVVSNKARWGLPEVTLGLIPGYGGTQRLSRNLGRSLARRIALSGDMFTAQQGYEWGLFAHLTEPEQLMPFTLKLAETLATRAPLAMSKVKQAINQGFDQQLAGGMKLEAELFASAFDTQDRGEGIKAFIEKRPPQFQGQ